MSLYFVVHVGSDMTVIVLLNPSIAFHAQDNNGLTYTHCVYQNNRSSTALIFISLTLNFSNRTTSMNVQVSFEENLDNSTKDSLVPVGGKNMMPFIDYINIPTVDIYGT